MDPKRLFDFLAASPSCYHAVQALSDRLTQEGYTQLHEADAWTLTAGGKYFVTRNGSSLLAFRVPAGAPAGFLMAAAHTDSPTFKIKHNPEKKAGPYVQLSTEKYGGMLMGTWFARPLSVAGRVVTAKDGKLETKLVDVDRDLLVIPSVAIHMNRNANDGMSYNAAVDMLLAADERTNQYITSTEVAGVVLDFIGGEPLLEVELIDQILDYFVAQTFRLHHPWATRWKASMSTNGTLYFCPEVQRFLDKWAKHLSLSISIDGD